MLTQTSELAIKTVLYLALEGRGEPISPRQLAQTFNCSASYLAKTANLLVKAGVLRSMRGVRGGVVLAKSLDQISLLEIVQACQGLMTGSYCRRIERSGQVCSFHQAMKELHEVTTGTLAKWTIRDLIAVPAKSSKDREAGCKMWYEGCKG